MSAACFTLRDLETWSRTAPSLAVLGHPIRHSLSPDLHNAALQQLAIAHPHLSDWKYFRLEITPEELPRALALLHEKNFVGLNLTIPHKVIAVPLLREIDPAARPIGAVNCLVRTPEGWRGHNTDGFGLATGIQQDLGLTPTGAHIILLGAGGAARGAAVDLLQRSCASLTIANRTAAHRDALLADLAPLAGKIPLRGIDPASPPADLPTGAIVINATSAGLKPDDPLPIALEKIPAPAAVYDMIYNPARTPLLARAEALGLRHANGLSMLVHQGARSLSHWTGLANIPADTMLAAAHAALARQ